MRVSPLFKKHLIIFLICFVLFLVLRLTFFSDFFLKYFYFEKIWVHRVNSIEKLKEVENDFFGVELDVFFLDNENTFDVTHPPEPSIGLSLFEYVESCESDELHFWLDFKNLNQSNVASSVNQLNNICNQLNIDKGRFIIESTTTNVINQFRAEGFNISYYLPWPGLNHLVNDSLTSMLTHINQNVETYGLTQISSNYHDYDIMKQQYPLLNKLLWLTGSEKEYINPIKERLYLYEILQDEEVRVLLIQHESEERNR